MGLDKKLFKAEAAADGGAASAEQNLILHLDANDLDSYDGSGDIWYDISEYDVTIPLSADDNNDLKLHLNASDTTSYDPATDTTTWTDISGNSNDATLTSLTNTDHDIDNGGYFDFDGVNDQAIVSHFSELESSARTYEFWVNFDSLGTQFFAGTYGGTDATRAFMFRLRGSSPYNTIRAQVYDGAGTALEPTGTKLIEAGEWYHIVFVSDNSDRSFKSYINGELDINQTLSFDVNTSSTEPFNLGRAGSGYTINRINGKIGQTRFYSKALSPSEVGQNYRHGRDYIYTDLYDSDPSTLQLHLDAGDDTTVSASTWSDKANSNNGTLTNFSSTLTDFYDKELGNWITFDGSNDVVTIPHSSGIDIGSSGFSAEAWVYDENTSGQSSIISNLHNTAGYTGYTLRIINGTDVQLFIYNNTTQTFTGTASSSISANTWNHLLFTVASNSSGAAVKLYINGELSSVNGTNSAAYGGSGNAIELGRYPFTSTKLLDGKIGQVRIYSTALDADEVMQNYLFTKNNYPNGYNGTIDGATFLPSGVSFDFDGSNDIVKNASLGTYFRGKTTLSISAWFKTDQSGRFTITSFSNTADASTDLWLGLNSGENTIGFRNVNDGSNNLQVDDSGGSSVRDGNWHHVVFTADSDGTHLYVDDSELTGFTYQFGSSSTTIVMPNDLNQFAVGANTDSGGNQWFMNGEISDVKVFDKALTAAEVTAEHAKGYNGAN